MTTPAPDIYITENAEEVMGVILGLSLGGFDRVRDGIELSRIAVAMRTIHAEGRTIREREFSKAKTKMRRA